MSRNDPPSYEMSTLKTPSGDDGANYTDISGIPADNVSDVYPEVVVSSEEDGFSEVKIDGGKSRTIRSAGASRQVGYQPGGTYNNGRLIPEASVWHTGSGAPRAEQNTTVVVNQPPVYSRPGPHQMIQTSHPTPTSCFNCNQNVVTYIYHESGAFTWAFCCGLALIGCVCGCCFVPFFVDSCKDSVHKCPNCHVILGKHKRL